jgi:hypothetical protein
MFIIKGESMPESSLITAFDKLIKIGRTWKLVQPLSGKKHTPQVTTWKDEFNLTKWDGWEYNFIVYKNELLDNGKSQEVSVRGTFQRASEMGNGADIFTALAVTFVRVLPYELERETEPPLTTRNFEGCSWEISEIRYTPSPEERGRIIQIDPLQKQH